MASAEIEQTPTTERWRRAVLGPLSPDFLRVTTPRDLQEAADRQAALALYQQQPITTSYMAPNIIGRLSITIAQAKLVRNYGFARMDPYVRVRVGHFVYETPTDLNGSKNPRWNRVIHSQLPIGVNSLYIEIFDECNFQMDELIAWTEIKIPESVLRGETHEEWYPLSGKQGEGLEGMLDLVLSFSHSNSVQNVIYQQAAPAPMVIVPSVSNRPMPVFISPQQPQVPPLTTTTIIPPQQIIQQPQQLQLHQQQQQGYHLQQQQQQPQQLPPQPVALQPVQINPEDIKQISEMFPNIDPEVIKSVYEVNRGNKDITINSLLQMTND